MLEGWENIYQSGALNKIMHKIFYIKGQTHRSKHDPTNKILQNTSFPIKSSRLND